MTTEPANRTELDDLIAQRWSDIRKMSRSKSQQVPGMDPDDVMSEMLLTLMKAHETFDEDSGLDIGQYWWSIWKRHRSNLVRNYYRIKRAQLVPIEDWTLDQLAGSFEDSSLPECPVDNELHRKCWHLLAIGFRASEVRKYLHLSVRKWYTVVSRWKTEEVREMLTT